MVNLTTIMRPHAQLGSRRVLYGQLGRHSSSSSSSSPIFSAKNTDVYPFGVPSNDPSRAWFVRLNWTISDSDCWAILAPSSSSLTKHQLLSTLLHEARYDPIGSAGHPILEELAPVERAIEQGGKRERTVQDLIQVVSFKTRLAGGGGGFDDYTARYYSIRDEDKLTTRQHLKEQDQEREIDDSELERMAKLLKMEQLLDLPLITLSNGQTRRARILRALLRKPELLILEEPFTGLDVESRELLVDLLTRLHSNRSPRVFLVLRPQDSLPPFISHLALVDPETSTEGTSSRGGGGGGGSGTRRVKFGTKAEILETSQAKELLMRGERERQALLERKRLRQEERKQIESRRDEEGGGGGRRRKLIELKNVNVTYGREIERPVLRDINWTIREGEKWVLAGHNGSGKSTLLSIILGDHPRSFSEDVTLFGKPRYRQATSTIQESIGNVSPEIFNAFPRRHGEQGLTAYDAIVTGFESIYSYRPPTRSQTSAITSLLTSLSHPLLTEDFLSRTLFASLTPGEQSLILLVRALVKKPKLLILDEPFQGMDQETIEVVKRYLERGLERDQAVVLISHFEEEVPEHGFDKRLELDRGKIKELF